MIRVFDLIETINEKVQEYLDTRGYNPESVVISPRSYRRLIEIKSFEHAIGNLVIGCAKMSEIATTVGNLHLIIDEILSDTEVKVV